MIRSGESALKIMEYMRTRGEYLISDHAIDKLEKFVFSPNEVYEKVLVEENSFKKKILHIKEHQFTKTVKKSNNKISVL